MSNVYRINLEKMEQIATRINYQTRELEETLKQIDLSIDDLLTEWEGDASQAFKEQWTRLEPNYQAGNELLHGISATLQRIARMARDQDSEIAGMLLQ